MMFHLLMKRRVFFLVLLAFLSIRSDFSVHAQSRGQRGPAARAAEGPPLGKSATEKRILAVLEDLDRNQRSRLTVPVEDARLLRLLTESIDAKHVVELGTATVIPASGSPWRFRPPAASSPPLKSIPKASNRRGKTSNAPVSST